MTKLINRELIWRHWNDTSFVLSFIKSSTFFAFALIVNYFAVRYATEHAGMPVSDLILNFLPVTDTSSIDYYFALYLQYGVFLFALTQVEKLVFFMNTTSILILVRAFFVNLTQLGIPEGGVPTVSFFTQGGDLFFSGHTALPFLAALVFWEIRSVRYIFLFLTLLMGIEVLMGHQHYSIDVFAAPFITYGVYVVSKRFFVKDYVNIKI